MDTIQKTINAIRILSAEQVQKANSGHPGLPMGAAPAAYTLYAQAMNYNPADPDWDNRDRFILSAGHGSALIYSLLHLFGFGLTIEDLKGFRQLGSLTPGHPEYRHTKGVETSTGPLGQGVANAVGFAMAEKHLAAKFNREGYPVVDHYTYAICGDGCMMEGIASEACSLAGTLGLGKLILLYDSNNITIEGNTTGAFREDVAARFRAYGWQVIEVADGNDQVAIASAINVAKADKDRPSLIKIKSIIGYGCEAKQGTAGVHGEPLGVDNLKATKKFLGWPEDSDFWVPDEVYAHTAEVAKKGAAKEEAWKALFADYAKAYPELAAEYEDWYRGELPDLWNDEDLFTFTKPDATRNTSGQVLNKLADRIPNFFGGSADLAPSNKSDMKKETYFAKENPEGKNIHFGVREHAMAAICNGIALHGGLRTYCATFFVFSDYLKHGVRMSSIMGLPVTYILTHDSIGVGEDGPTHQPVEQLAALRSIPGMTVYRPADGVETTVAWIAALQNNGPTALVLTRQNLPQYGEVAKNAVKGAYVISDAQGTPDILLLASGSEVEQMLAAQKVLREQGVEARVVSMPSFEVFEKQSAEYKESVLPKAVRARLAMEAASSFGWGKYVGLDGDIISIDTFGASGKAAQVFQKFGITTENVVERALKLLGK